MKLRAYGRATGLHTAMRWRRSQSLLPQTKTPAPRANGHRAQERMFQHHEK
jgi:hypothetical protein